MPCYDPSTKIYREDNKQIQELAQRINTLTQLLCEATQTLSSICGAGYYGIGDFEDEASPELLAWKLQHDKDDSERRQNSKFARTKKYP